MGIFNDLLGKILAHAGSAQPVAGGLPAAPAATNPVPTSAPAADATAAVSAVPAVPDVPEPMPLAPVEVATGAPVDVAAVMNSLAAKNPEHLDWKRSIVDMLKLLGMDNSLSARRKFAEELNYPGDEHDSAAMNEWLHKAVWQKIADSGGEVPGELLG